MKKSIAIIDYQMSNLFSVSNAVESLGFEVQLVRNSKELLSADAAILPGVGAFGEAMDNLRSLDLIDPIKDFINSGKPFMGICLGFQLLFSESDEHGTHAGFDIIPGEVRHLSKNLKELAIIPHVGWNKVIIPEENKNHLGKIPVENDSFMYFVHSHYVRPADHKYICTETEYNGFKFCSSILKANVFASQFHPEKGGSKGLSLLNKFFNERLV